MCLGVDLARALVDDVHDGKRAYDGHADHADGERDQVVQETWSVDDDDLAALVDR